jgi:hypothetical protein
LIPFSFKIFWDMRISETFAALKTAFIVTSNYMEAIQHVLFAIKNCYEVLCDHFWAKVMRTNRIPSF